MTQVLDRLHADSTLLKDADELHCLIRSYISKAPERASDVQLQRGVATIPLNGIDVPFHSTYLRGGIAAYREFLEEKILKENVDPDKLVGKFIPNVMGKPFSVEKNFVQEVADVTGSETIQKLLASVSPIERTHDAADRRSSGPRSDGSCEWIMAWARMAFIRCTHFTSMDRSLVKHGNQQTQCFMSVQSFYFISITEIAAVIDHI